MLFIKGINLPIRENVSFNFTDIIKQAHVDDQTGKSVCLLNDGQIEKAFKDR